jgi:hypothetical protein
MESIAEQKALGAVDKSKKMNNLNKAKIMQTLGCK